MSLTGRASSHKVFPWEFQAKPWPIERFLSAPASYY